jgi:MFS family permease
MTAPADDKAALERGAALIAAASAALFLITLTCAAAAFGQAAGLFVAVATLAGLGLGAAFMLYGAAGAIVADRAARADGTLGERRP